MIPDMVRAVSEKQEKYTITEWPQSTLGNLKRNLYEFDRYRQEKPPGWTKLSGIAFLKRH